MMEPVLLVQTCLIGEPGMVFFSLATLQCLTPIFTMLPEDTGNYVAGNQSSMLPSDTAPHALEGNSNSDKKDPTLDWVYNDPKADMTLISEDNVVFKISSWVFTRNQCVDQRTSCIILIVVGQAPSSATCWRQ